MVPTIGPDVRPSDNRTLVVFSLEGWPIKPLEDPLHHLVSPQMTCKGNSVYNAALFFCWHIQGMRSHWLWLLNLLPSCSISISYCNNPITLGNGSPWFQMFFPPRIQPAAAAQYSLLKVPPTECPPPLHHLGIQIRWVQVFLPLGFFFREKI